MLPLTTDLNETKTQRQQLHVMVYLASFHPDANSARSQIIVGTEIPTLMEACFRVLRITKVVGPDTSDVHADRSILGVVRGRFHRGRGSRHSGRIAGREGGRGNVGHDGGRPYTCFNCDQPGHFQ